MLGQQLLHRLGEFHIPNGQRPSHRHLGVIAGVGHLLEKGQTFLYMLLVHKVGELHHTGGPGEVLLPAGVQGAEKRPHLLPVLRGAGL